MSQTTLDRIVENRRAQVEQLKREVPLSALEARIEANDPPRNFSAMLRGPQVKIIAEIARASIESGPFMQIYDPRVLAQEFSGNNAAAISCVTEETCYDGDGFLIHRARNYMPLPVVRRDFIIDDYQLYESRALEADAVNLVAATLSDLNLRLSLSLVRDLGMDAMVEAFGAQDIKRALDANAKVVAINNWDLDAPTANIERTVQLAGLVPDDVILVSIGGVRSLTDVKRLAVSGVDAVLVGSMLMRSEEPGWILRRLTGVDAQPGRR